MKKILSGLLALFFCGILIQAGCSKEDDVVQVTPPPNADQYITWKIGNTQGFLASPSDTLWISKFPLAQTVIFGSTADFSSSVYANFDGITAGSFPAYVNIFTGNKYYVSNNTPAQISISSFGNIGGYVTGSYSGTLKDSTGTATFSATGAFKLKRR